MTDTLFRDLSEHNAFEVDKILNSTSERVVLFRSNDGTYCDHKFAQNLELAKAAADSGRLDCFGVYFVFEDNWRETLTVFKRQVGRPHPKMFVVIDLESWGGKIKGDHSTQVEACRKELLAWLRSFRGPLGVLVDKVLRRQPKRVLLYGNEGDLQALAPRVKNMRLIVAAYGSNPAVRHKLAHQFGDAYVGDGLPAGDINSADGLSPRQFAAAVGCNVLGFRDRVQLFKRHHLSLKSKRKARK